MAETMQEKIARLRALREARDGGTREEIAARQRQLAAARAVDRKRQRAQAVAIFLDAFSYAHGLD